MIDCIELSPEETAFTLLLEKLYPYPMPPKKEVVMADTPIVGVKMANNVLSQIVGLTPLNDSDAKRLGAVLKEAWPYEDAKPRGGLISPPMPGCDHHWVRCSFVINGSIAVSVCSKCRVLGLPAGD